MGKTLSQNPTAIETFKKIFNDLSAEIGKVSNSADATLGPIFNAIALFILYTPFVYWAAFCICFYIFILGGIMLMVLVGNEDNCKCCMKFMLIELAFFTFLIALISISLLASAVFITTTCKTIPGVLNANSSSIIFLFIQCGVNEATNDPQFKAILQNCLASGESESLLKVMNQDNTISRTTLDFLKDLTAYNSISTNFTKEGLISTAITNSIADWNNFKTFKSIDQPKALRALTDLNQEVSCDGRSFQMTVSQCGTKKKCGGVAESAISDLQNCAIRSAQAFQNLKDFVTNEFSLMQDLTTKLTGNTPKTPNSSQKIYRDKMKNLLGDFSAIRNKIGGFLTTSNIIQGDFEDNANCKILRSELKYLEGQICFKINNPIYFVSALLFFIGFLMFIMMWCICCGMRYQEKKVKRLIY